MQFVDTNILLYAYDAAAGERHEKALAVITSLARERTGALSAQVLQEFYVNATRKFVVPLTPDEARSRVRVLSRWTTHSPTAGDVVAASEIAERNHVSFWDAMIVRSASELGCDTLFSEDLSPGQLIEGVRVVNPLAVGDSSPG